MEIQHFSSNSFISHSTRDIFLGKSKLAEVMISYTVRQYKYFCFLSCQSNQIPSDHPFPILLSLVNSLFLVSFIVALDCTIVLCLSDTCTVLLFVCFYCQFFLLSIRFNAVQSICRQVVGEQCVFYSSCDGKNIRLLQPTPAQKRQTWASSVKLHNGIH